MGVTPPYNLSECNKNSGIIPLVVEEKYYIDEEGNRKIKRIITHNRQFPAPSGHSINNRVIKEPLNPCFCGLFLLDFLHIIESMHRSCSKNTNRRNRPRYGITHSTCQRRFIPILDIHCVNIEILYLRLMF